MSFLCSTLEVVRLTFSCSTITSRCNELLEKLENSPECFTPPSYAQTIFSALRRGTLGICGVAALCTFLCGVAVKKNSQLAVLRWSQALQCAMFAFLSLRCSVKTNYLRYSRFHNFWTNDFPETFLYRRGSSNFSTQLCSHFHWSSRGTA